MRWLAATAAFLCLRAAAPSLHAQWESITYVDASIENTQAVRGSPSPFWTTDKEDPGFTSGALWYLREGYGFDQGGFNGIYEKDASKGFADAAMLMTTITGLNPGQAYGIYVCFLSAEGEEWRIQAGLSPSKLTLLTPSDSSNRITNLGLSSDEKSNRAQLLGYIGNATADKDGKIVVYIDDTDATKADKRCWYDAVAYGPPVAPIASGLPPQANQLVTDGAWTWFNNPRAYFHGGRLYLGYVKAATGKAALSVWSSGQPTAAELFSLGGFEKDDHNNPGITPTCDGRLLVLSSCHSIDRLIASRLSATVDPASLADWNDERTFSLPPSGGDKTTYHNPFMLSAEGGRIYNFIRYLNFNPTVITSDTNGATWNQPVHLIKTGTGSNVRPYFQYTSNYKDRIDFIYTDGHPLDVECSVYHTYYKSNATGTPGAGNLHQSDGSVLKPLAHLPLNHDAPALERGSVIYQYSSAPSSDPNQWIQRGRAWVWDLAYDATGQPVCVFQVQSDDVTGSGWKHDRIYYYYARWTGTAWQKRLIAQGGRGLYPTQRDYGGGITLDPVNPNVIYISSNAAHPFALGNLVNVPLSTGERYEIYRGVTRDGGLTFQWTPITQNSSEDNLRPYVPRGHSFSRALVWFRGTYSAYTDFDTHVYGLFTNAPEISVPIPPLPQKIVDKRRQQHDAASSFR